MVKKKFAAKALLMLACLAIVLVTALLGSLFTGPGTKSPWYDTIRPSITPPNFVFPIAWTILFMLIAVSLFFAWLNSDKKEKKRIAIVFAVNFVLNVLWSALFFGLRMPWLAFIEIIMLWLSILMMILVTWRISRLASWLLVPYIAWVTFACVLNYLAAFA